MNDIPPNAARVRKTGSLLINGELAALQFELIDHDGEGRWSDYILLHAAACRQLAAHLTDLADMLEKGGRNAN